VYVTAVLRVGVRRALIIAAHLALWSAAFLTAFLLRFEFAIPRAYLEHFAAWLPALLALRLLAFYQAGLFRGLWRYTGTRDFLDLVVATAASSGVFAIVLQAGGYAFFPRSILIIEGATAFLLVASFRFGARVTRWTIHGRRDPASGEARRLLVVGAGDAGEMMVREVSKMHASRYRPVAFVDDDRSKLGARIHGVRVAGTIGELADVAAEREAQEIVIAIPTATGDQMRRIVAQCKATGLPFKTIPGLDHLIDGRVTVNQLREVAIEDLLGREPVQLETSSISEAIAGRVVMVTGAGGSIGSELCRQACRFGPSRLVLVERTENALFNVHRELEAAFPSFQIVPCVADVGDESRMAELLGLHRPDVVLHAAAHKHVPMMEWNPGEAVKNNVFGTKMLADLADRFEVERFVMISTDKAVNPTSVMGVSKRVAEMYVQALSQRSRTRFVTVRFGNVLGSAGSVIPIFQEQIAKGGPVTVTHPEMTRYFMTIPEASQLVLQAGAMGNGGEIFILDMGEPVRIADLARDLITLSGLTPDVDVAIEFTGVRPGEKLFEELSVAAESADGTRHPKIFVGRFRPVAWDVLQRQLDALARVKDGTPEDVRRRFREIVPEYQPFTVPSLVHEQKVRAIAS
jgi:FlaA1/EpsC-like NDP-sugar epimerase